LVVTIQSKHIPVFVVFMLIGVSLLFHARYINEFPSYIHAWAQSDRYALALGFVENGHDLLHPQTFVHNPQFPGEKEYPSTETITAVDFPIHDYIVSIAMKLSGDTAPWLFRLYTLIYSLVGLFYLFRFAKSVTNSPSKSILVVLFAATSPVFVYYQSGFLPSIPSLSNAFIALFFYSTFLRTSKQNNLYYALSFLTLATLSRSTFLILLLSVIGIEFLRAIKQPGKAVLRTVFLSLSLIPIVGYYLYNGYLRREYGSIFLSSLLPPESLSEAIDILSVVKTTWLTHYFSVYHYLIVAVLILFYVVYRVYVNYRSSLLELNLMGLLGIATLGYLCFSMVMMKQLPAHDYYFLDSFFASVILFLVLILIPLPENILTGSTFAKIFIPVLIALPMIANGYRMQQNRRDTGPWDKTGIVIRNFTDSDVWLTEQGVSRDAKLLVFDPYAPNIPFILMNRTGFAVPASSHATIDTALMWDADYIIFQNEFFLSDIYPIYPEFMQKTKRIATNGGITVCIASSSSDSVSIEEYLGLNQLPPALATKVDFDSPLPNGWRNEHASSLKSKSGIRAHLLDAETEYGITFATTQLPVLQQKSTTLRIAGYFLPVQLMDVELVIAIREQDKSTYYNSINLKPMLQPTPNWQEINLMYQLPLVQEEEYELTIFLWNTGKGELFVDDLSLRFY